MSEKPESETQFIKRTRREALLNDFKKLRRHQQEAISEKLGLPGVESADALSKRVYLHAKETGALAYLYNLIVEYGHRSRRGENPFEGK